MYCTFLDITKKLSTMIDIHNEETSDLGVLASVYFDALENPPAGVIGVGAITHAEQAIQAFQVFAANANVTWTQLRAYHAQNIGA